MDAMNIRLSAIRTAIRASEDAQRKMLGEWAALNNAVVHENDQGFLVISKSAGRSPRADEKFRVLPFWTETIFYGPAESFIIKE